ncbi:MAG: hypothetical protein SVR08_09240 [Spirochaetota bacterium]|nr:hypothetical protein [Spirochaetota bacterium]
MRKIFFVSAIIICMSFALLANDPNSNEKEKNNYRHRYRVEQKKMSENKECIKEMRKTRKKLKSSFRNERRTARKELKAGK